MHKLLRVSLGLCCLYVFILGEQLASQYGAFQFMILAYVSI